jgi:hypothetical protein
MLHAQEISEIVGQSVKLKSNSVGRERPMRISAAISASPIRYQVQLFWD